MLRYLSTLALVLALITGSAASIQAQSFQIADNQGLADWKPLMSGVVSHYHGTLNKEGANKLSVDLDNWCTLAGILDLRGEKDLYRDLCVRAYLESTAQKNHARSQYLGARIGTFAPNSPINSDDLIRLAAAAERDKAPWHTFVLGRAYYRAEKFDDAQRCFARVQETDWCKVLVWQALANTHRKQGNLLAALPWRQKAVEWINVHGRQNSLHHNDLIDLHIVLRDWDAFSLPVVVQEEGVGSQSAESGNSKGPSIAIEQKEPTNRPIPGAAKEPSAMPEAPVVQKMPEFRQTGPAVLTTVLSKDDPIYPHRNAPHRVHSFRFVTGTTYVIDMVSKDFDSYLFLEDAAGKVLAQDDDGGGFPNARILFQPTATGAYRIIATVFTSVTKGRYTITITEKGKEASPAGKIDEPGKGPPIIDKEPRPGRIEEPAKAPGVIEKAPEPAKSKSRGPSWLYDNGEFRNLDNGRWEEWNAGRVIYRFDEIDATSDCVTLLDRSRNISVRLRSNRCDIYHGDRHVGYYDGGWAAPAPSASPSPLPPTEIPAPATDRRKE